MKKNVRICLILFFTFTLLLSGWKLWQINSGYREGHSSYKALEQYVSFEETLEEPTLPDPMYSSTAPTQMPDVSHWPQVDFIQLSEINPDVVGWICIDGTNINYPIVQGGDNDYYLTHLFDGSWNGSGCIFLDCRSNVDFSDSHSIIYGHNMKDGKMFAGLMDYKAQAFYAEHPTALLVTPGAYYEIQFFSGYVTDDADTAWELSPEEEWLEAVQMKSYFTPEILPKPGDRIVTLSTCSYEFMDAKFVLHGYISEEISTES